MGQSLGSHSKRGRPQRLLHGAAGQRERGRFCENGFVCTTLAPVASSQGHGSIVPFLRATAPTVFLPTPGTP